MIIRLSAYNKLDLKKLEEISNAVGFQFCPNDIIREGLAVMKRKLTDYIKSVEVEMEDIHE